MSRIAFKSPELIDQWHFLHPTLQKVIEYLAAHVWFPVLDQDVLTITSAIRPGKGIHSTGRAVDVSVLDWRSGALLPSARRTRAAGLINGVWRYGKDSPTTGRPYLVCYHHKVDGSQWHYHIQVRDETRQIDAG